MMSGDHSGTCLWTACFTQEHLKEQMLETETVDRSNIRVLVEVLFRRSR